MELSSSREAATWAETRELSSISWNPKVHYRGHKSLPLVPILGQIDPVHIIPNYLSKIYFNIVHPPPSWLSYCPTSFWLSHQYAFLFSPFVLHALRISSNVQINGFYHKKRISCYTVMRYSTQHINLSGIKYGFKECIPLLWYQDSTIVTIDIAIDVKVSFVSKHYR
jgi:hypothetical protein